jgi:hypothetical protein
VNFHADYPEKSPKIIIIDSANVEDVSPFEDEIQKIVCKELSKV